MRELGKLTVGEECKFVVCEEEKPEMGKVVGINGEIYIVQNLKGTEYNGKVNIMYDINSKTDVWTPVVHFKEFTITKVGERDKMTETNVSAQIQNQGGFA